MNIHPTDKKAMNSLYRSELVRTGNKTAAEADLDAFRDHEEYEKLLEEVLKEDSKQSWDPNDPILD